MRQKEAGKPVIFEYNELPREFRVQVIHIWTTALGVPGASDFSGSNASARWWLELARMLAREMGTFGLSGKSHEPFKQCQDFILTETTENVLSIIELTFRFIDSGMREVSYTVREECNVSQTPDDAIDELNGRFRLHKLGYKYENSQIVRVDSEYVHAEVVAPALSLLHDLGFQGASDEFMRAHQHYREGRNKEAIAQALNSFESTMKSICKARGWDYPKDTTARPLFDLLIKRGLIPPKLESHFTGLRAALESGLPTLSNDIARHGQGKDIQQVDIHFAAYALHLAAADIVFLVALHNATK